MAFATPTDNPWFALPTAGVLMLETNGTKHPHHNIQIITISREFGAGGSILANALGQRLGWPVLDHDLVHRVAERLRVDDGTVEELDEHPPSLMARVASVLIIPQPEWISFPPESDVSADAIANASRAVIEEAAGNPPIIIVGHGAQCLFGARTDVLHVRVIAPIRIRLARVAERLKVDPAFAGALLNRADRDRQAYVHRYFNHDLREDLLYDVRLNTGRLSIDECVVAITNLIEQRRSEVTADAPATETMTRAR